MEHAELHHHLNCPGFKMADAAKAITILTHRIVNCSRQKWHAPSLINLHPRIQTERPKQSLACNLTFTRRCPPSFLFRTTAGPEMTMISTHIASGTKNVVSTIRLSPCPHALDGATQEPFVVAHIFMASVHDSHL